MEVACDYCQVKWKTKKRKKMEMKHCGHALCLDCVECHRPNAEKCAEKIHCDLCYAWLYDKERELAEAAQIAMDESAAEAELRKHFDGGNDSGSDSSSEDDDGDSESVKLNELFEKKILKIKEKLKNKAKL